MNPVGNVLFTLWISQKFPKGDALNALEISEGRRVKPSLEIYSRGDLVPYTLRGISQKYALLLGQCSASLDSVQALLSTIIQNKDMTFQSESVK